MDIHNLTITAAQQKELMENRAKCPYLVPVECGKNYPIPKLVGAVRKILVDQNNMGAEDLTIGYAVFQPGDYHEPHAHKECEEFMYVISGKIVGGVGDGEESIQQEGDVLFMPRGAKHWFYNPFDEPQTHLFVYTRPSLATAGYSLESEGFEEIGAKVESAQGVNA